MTKVKIFHLSASEQQQELSMQMIKHHRGNGGQFSWQWLDSATLIIDELYIPHKNLFFNFDTQGLQSEAVLVSSYHLAWDRRVVGKRHESMSKAFSNQ